MFPTPRRAGALDRGLQTGVRVTGGQRHREHVASLSSCSPTSPSAPRHSCQPHTSGSEHRNCPRQKRASQGTEQAGEGRRLCLECGQMWGDGGSQIYRSPLDPLP